MTNPTDPGIRRFDGKVALVTGAANGIGAATARRLATEGARLTITDVDTEGLAATLDDIGADTSIAVPCDVSDDEAVRHLVEASMEHHGRLDSTINMAGILAAAHSHEETLEQWNRIIGVNLTGCFLVCRETIPHLLETGGTIVNAASTASLSGHPWFSAYGASKGGVLMLTQSLALEYATRGLRANAVAPGGISTDMTANVALPDDVDFQLLARMMPVGPFGEPEAVADTIAFLASDDARFINGEFVRVDGATLA